jgi:hypothetical protein
MAFSANVNWPQGLLNQVLNIFFVSHHQNARLESHYYGAYNRLFNYAVVEALKAHSPSFLRLRVRYSLLILIGDSCGLFVLAEGLPNA